MQQQWRRKRNQLSAMAIRIQQQQQQQQPKRSSPITSNGTNMAKNPPPSSKGDNNVNMNNSGIDNYNGYNKTKYKKKKMSTIITGVVVVSSGEGGTIMDRVGR
mmetsp:Transcript_26908/g.64221  ORF Transcript_26908/g.64221 Transcript_26908/m.64221 type:complete len:103 (-) Transcript_26908:54-362(-)